jgi:hypothetical protein
LNLPAIQPDFAWIKRLGGIDSSRIDPAPAIGFEHQSGPKSRHRLPATDAHAPRDGGSIGSVEVIARPGRTEPGDPATPGF